jgi:hypothetical protein
MQELKQGIEDERYKNKQESFHEWDRSQLVDQTIETLELIVGSVPIPARPQNVMA